MSLARAFTKRVKRTEDDGSSSTPLARGNTIKYTPGTISRHKISLPTELISTTNVQALTAPDIGKFSAASSSSSINSGNDSDFSTIDRSFLVLNGDDSPITPITPPSETRKDFFEGIQLTGAPAIPQRSPSHSKKAHVELSRQRSVQRMSPPPTMMPKSAAVRNSAEMFAAKSETEHPFGPELAQVNEVAEEFGAGKSVLDEEEKFMQSRGLMKFGVQDYILEIQQMFGGVLEDRLGPGANPWL